MVSRGPRTTVTASAVARTSSASRNAASSSHDGSALRDVIERTSTSKRPSSSGATRTSIETRAAARIGTTVSQRRRTASRAASKGASARCIAAGPGTDNATRPSATVTDVSASPAWRTPRVHGAAPAGTTVPDTSSTRIATSAPSRKTSNSTGVTSG